MLKSLEFTDSSNNVSFPVKSVTLHLDFVAICVNGVCVCQEPIFVQLKSISLFSFQLL